MYPTLDLVYIHIWFTSENAILVPLTWGPISVAYAAILEWIEHTERRDKERGENRPTVRLLGRQRK